MAVTMRRLRIKRSQCAKNSVRLSPSMPTTARMASGSEMTMTKISRQLKGSGRYSSGIPVPAASTAASTALRSRMLPPNSVLVSMKLGGMK